jgi:anhydro-N-acetylmuramic acid kinase
MIYRVLGLMSGSSLDGLDLAYVHLHSGAGKWGYTLEAAKTLPYTPEWRSRLEGATTLDARSYLLLHQEYGHYLGAQVNSFIQASGLDFQVQLVASHGHTVFHQPGNPGMTAQLGSGAAIAAVTGLQTVTDLRALDVALGGQGAPIVPIGEKWLFPGYAYFLNLGGIANVSDAAAGIAFDVCAANRVLNLLAEQKGFAFDKGGELAASGKVIPSLLKSLDGLSYYRQAPPKSLDNAFGVRMVMGTIRDNGCSTEDGLRTYVEHIARQVATVFAGRPAGEMLVTGGGAHNGFLMERLRDTLTPLNIQVTVPEAGVVDFKEALVVALFGVLRLRQEENTLASVTGATRNSIGGALWNGQEG